MQLIGQIREIVRYPVKSMAGVAVESAMLGWHGIEGDRRFAFRRVGDESGFPWLTASRLAELVLYHPVGAVEGEVNEPLATHVRTPDGRLLELGSAELRGEIAERFGGDVELMKLKHGIFDDASVSVIGSATIAGIGREAEGELDRRRFRANIVIETVEKRAFVEDEWVGGTLVFGDSESGPAVAVTARDGRCVMINIDPETAMQNPRVLKAVSGLNGANAGVYGTVLRTGVVGVGNPVSFGARVV